MMKKCLLIFGTRPEAIKMAPLVREIKNAPDLECVVCVTAQHRQMLDQVLAIFDIVPDYDLDIMKSQQTLTDVTTRAMKGIEEVICQEAPDIVLVHGDTATAFAGAMAAFHNQIKIGHVEAGLRTYDKYSPYPEEMYRQMVDCVADYYFAPTETARQNLLQENKAADKIYVTGNTAIDVLKYTIKSDYSHEVLDWAKDSRLVLLTAHRRENLGEPMRGVFQAVKRIVDEYPDIKVVYPIHLNPVVRETAYDVFGKDNDRIKLIEPLDVVEFHNIMAQAYLVMTDSGGIQEEAPSLGKPVLVVRDTTERPEGVAAGTLLLVGTHETEVYDSLKSLITDEAVYRKMAETKNPYGDGTASEQIVEVLKR